ncbi:MULTISPECIES: TetR/AcrR family transcriptional regulator [unclassified Rothia (in: high G+C Gram-positive bacteria)]|uniref:TetR/AcrR family transcriptional regulator n=1 Tax=unclassified Rothia (in: high G+C Gram-positive bacteria) TaxID=2689056 RepID=UPI00195E155A|nr:MULTISPECIES: TetR/AcrR family transcriptional regulator [unclassified Rothia (in: high G+C Gram-positive bacteria)]MBM7050588.1 TetR/AcrR family transcriptional regulator [Rothia sp. ZJ1223]QRZ60783.1 TetR/AcrR family transcriptional regulator [Rothia sp. ZJ932]
MNLKTTENTKKPRADAVKNRQKILDVARISFETDGVNISMDAIAKAAGVGVGTLYRNFPNRETLIAAVLDEKTVKAPDITPEITSDPAASLQALTAWLRALADWFATYEGLTEPMRRAVEEYNSPLNMQCQDVIAQLDALLEPVQRAGLVRPEVTGRELYLATLGMAWAAQHSENPEVLYELLATGWRSPGM